MQHTVHTQRQFTCRWNVLQGSLLTLRALLQIVVKEQRRNNYVTWGETRSAAPIAMQLILKSSV
jgi:hypothetical protein